MKRKSLVIASLIMTAACAFTACGNKSEGDGGRREHVTTTSTETIDVTTVSTDEDTTDNDNANAVATFKGSIYEYEDSENLTDVTLTVLDDHSCQLREEYSYYSNTHTTYDYLCEYEVEDNIYTVTCQLDDGDVKYFVVEVNGNGEVVSFTEDYSANTETKEIAGTYTCDDDVYGHMVLTIKESGESVLETDAEVFTGNTYVYDDNWDFTGDNGEYDDEAAYRSVDMFVFFDGNNFTYKDYTQAMYESYAGTYKMVGTLGNFDLTVDDHGNAYCDIKIEGKKTRFNGSINTYESEDDYNEIVISFYLNSEDDQYSISIDVNEFDDGTYNYYGTLSKVLGAG